MLEDEGAGLDGLAEADHLTLRHEVVSPISILLLQQVLGGVGCLSSCPKSVSVRARQQSMDEFFIEVVFALLAHVQAFSEDVR